MKVIFLDVDGVLNSHEYAVRWSAEGNSGILGTCPTLVERFKQLVRDTGARVVLSSTWRLSPDRIQMLEHAGIVFQGKTPALFSNYYRHIEIARWLEGRDDIEDYVILDDDADAGIEDHFYQTHWKTGLTEQICNQIRERFGIE